MQTKRKPEVSDIHLSWKNWTGKKNYYVAILYADDRSSELSHRPKSNFELNGLSKEKALEAPNSRQKVRRFRVIYALMSRFVNPGKGNQDSIESGDFWQRYDILRSDSRSGCDAGRQRRKVVMPN
ncbi:unnamed protein product, partial [Mesorhabditis spiculigera]